MANDLPYDSYGSNGPQVYQPDTFQPSPQAGSSQPATSPPPATAPQPPIPPKPIPSVVSQAIPNLAQPNPAIGSFAKEQLESAPVNYSETIQLTEITSEHDKIPEAVEGWLEKLERQEDIKLDQPITDDQNQPVLQSATPQVTDDQIILPLEETDVSQGIKQKPTSSIRWLAEWCLRVIKKFPGKVFYAS